MTWKKQRGCFFLCCSKTFAKDLSGFSVSRRNCWGKTNYSAFFAAKIKVQSTGNQNFSFVLTSVFLLLFSSPFLSPRPQDKRSLVLFVVGGRREGAPRSLQLFGCLRNHRRWEGCICCNYHLFTGERFERGIKFFTVSRVSELLGLLEDAKHLGHIVGDCNTGRKWIFSLCRNIPRPHTHTHTQQLSHPSCASRSVMLPSSLGNEVVGWQRGNVTASWFPAVTDAASQAEGK